MPNFSRLAGLIGKGIKAGIDASKVGNSVPKIMFADAAQMAASRVTSGDLLSNAVARATNAVANPGVSQNILHGGISMMHGANPVVAVGSNIAGNFAGRIVGDGLRSKLDLADNSWRAGGAELLTNLGVSMVGSNILGGMFQSSPETEDRQQIQMVQSQLTAPSAGGSRQFADLLAAQGSYQAPGRMESIPRFADGDAASMVGLPPLDAATADKLRKRAIENAQQNYFLSGELNNYMDGLK